MTENAVIERGTAIPMRRSVALGTFWGAVAALVVNITIWFVGRAGEPIRVVTGWAPDGADLTFVEVVATTVVAVGLGSALLARMQRRFDRFPAWAIIVASVTVASALPLWSLDIDTGSKVALSCMHLATGVCAIAAQSAASVRQLERRRDGVVDLLCERARTRAVRSQPAPPAPAYLAIIRRGGSPRVHPLTSIITDDSIFVFMEPTSPKLADLVARRRFALHTRGDDIAGTTDEALLTGSAKRATDPAIRPRVADLAPYYPADRYELVKLVPTGVKVRGYGDITLPSPVSWKLIADERTMQC